MGSKIKGTNLAGMSTTRNRAEDDFYATPFETTKAIQDRFKVGIIGHIGKGF